MCRRCHQSHLYVRILDFREAPEAVRVDWRVLQLRVMAAVAAMAAGRGGGGALIRVGPETSRLLLLRRLAGRAQCVWPESLVRLLAAGSGCCTCALAAAGASLCSARSTLCSCGASDCPHPMNRPSGQMDKQYTPTVSHRAVCVINPRTSLAW